MMLVWLLDQRWVHVMVLLLVLFLMMKLVLLGIGLLYFHCVCLQTVGFQDLVCLWKCLIHQLR